MPSLCPACSLHILRKPGGSVACIRCKRLFHSSCLNPYPSSPLAPLTCPGCAPPPLHTTSPSVTSSPLPPALSSATSSLLRAPLLNHFTPNAQQQDGLPISEALISEQLPRPFSQAPAHDGLLEVQALTDFAAGPQPNVDSLPAGLPFTQACSSESGLLTEDQSGLASNNSNGKRLRDSPPSNQSQQLKIHRSLPPTSHSSTMNPEATAAAIAKLPQDMQTLWQLFDNKIDQVTHAFDKRISNIEEDVNSLKSSVGQIQEASKLYDDCELRVLGIPPNFLDTVENQLEAMKRILHKINCEAATYALLKVRVWAPPARQNADNAAVPPTPGLVAQFASPLVRDEVIKAAPRLKGLNSNSIFQDGSNSNIFIRALYPPVVSALLAKARTHAKAINYWPPVVRNLTIYMRNNRSSLIPIHCEEDLKALSPNPRPTLGPNPAAPTNLSATRSNV